jgi:hypothetical protein
MAIGNFSVMAPAAFTDTARISTVSILVGAVKIVFNTYMRKYEMQTF